MSSSAFKRKLSGSTDGKAIKITQTATPGDTIHTAVAGTTAGTLDEIWIWAFNSHTTVVTLTIEFGGNIGPDNLITQTIPFKKGVFLIIPGLLLQNTLKVRACAGTANVVTIMGFENAIVDS